VRVTAHRLVLTACYVILLGTALYFAMGGMSYYLTPVIDRPHHPLYWAFKPGGRIGHPLGIAGSAMMVLMLFYSVRKRMRALRHAGAIGVWLDYHILLGICGPVFVILHSSFKVHGLVALSFWSMILVALSGVMGRYLYRQIPRSRAGDELSLGEVHDLEDDLTRRLVNEFALPPEAIEELDGIAREGAGRRSLTLLVLRLPLDALTLRHRLRRFRARYPQVQRALGRAFERAARRKAQLHRRIAMWERLHRLFHYWHVVHKPFAVIMYLFMVVHVAVAWVTGYGWVGG
jgi:hypothetical protein